MIWAVTALLCACSGEKAGQVRHSVMTVAPQGAGSEHMKSLSGIVKEHAEISLGFKTGGEIERMLVQDGDHVRKGQLLAVLDAKDYQLGVDAVQIQYDQLQGEVQRLRQLYQGKSLSGNDYEKAVSGLQQLGVQLQANKNKLSYTRLYAPQDGVVYKTHFQRAEMVGAGTPVITLLDVHRMEVEVSVPQSIYQQRDRIGSIECTTGGRRIPLRLVSIVPKADNNQLYTMRLSLGDTRLTAGQNVEVTLVMAATEHADKLTLPLSCLFEDNGRTYVWTVSTDSTVHRREVTLGGIDDAGHSVIASGLTGDETVVRAGVGVLREGEKVQVISQPTATNVGRLI